MTTSPIAPINDGYGDQPLDSFDVDPDSPDHILSAYTRWLHKMANSYLPPEDARHDDLVQEGHIAMWRALATYDPTKGALPAWLTTAAKMRMKDFAFGHAQPTGKEASRGRREAEISASVDDLLLDSGLEHLLAASDALEGIELAYHHGEIWQALEALSPAQRRYVLARFWGGLDPSSRIPGQQELRKLVPEISRRYLWVGTTKQVGARDRLAKALAHLAV